MQAGRSGRRYAEVAFPGFARGAPKAQDVATRKDVQTMKKDELMRYAKNILGVPDGKASLRGSIVA